MLHKRDDIYFSESLNELIIEFIVPFSQLESYNQYLEFISYVNIRDNFILNLYINSEQGIVFKTNEIPSQEDFSDFISILDDEDIISFKFVVNKNLSSNRYSLYHPSLFLHWLEKKDFESTCLFYKDIFHDGHIQFEIQFKTNEFLKTPFLQISSNISNIEFDSKSIQLQKYSKYTSFTKYNIVPEDFNVLESTELSGYVNYFNKLKSLISLLYLSNYYNIEKNVIRFRFEGNYFYEDVCEYCLVEFNEILYELYSWIYTNKNIQEKLILSRNIISMNCNPNNSILKITDTLYDTILTNFVLFENDNVKNYIDLKKQIADCIVKANHEILEMINQSLDRFKNNVVLLITTILASILPIFKDQEMQNAFIIKLITVFSIFYLIITIFEYLLKKKRILQLYESLKELYSDLLSTGDSNILFADSKLKHNLTQARNYIASLLFIWGIVIYLILDIMG